MFELPEKFIRRMSDIDGFEAFLKSYETPPVRAIRVNNLKISVEDFKKISPFDLKQVPWEKTAFYVSGEGLGKTILHAAGLYYVQEPSATAVVPELEIAAGERVLDLCAAPGGKSTQIAQYLNNKGVLVSNEIDFDRCKILKSNIERLGVKNVAVTCCAPEKIAESFPEYFDKVLVDAPCSGEGMFKKEESAIKEWSEENIKRCSKRQSEILSFAAQALKGGGRLVYSTCTFAKEEDEEQIESFLSAHPEFKLIKMKKLLPHEVKGEGHFLAVMHKQNGSRAEVKLRKPKANESMLKLYRDWESQTLNFKADNIYCDNERVYSFLNDFPEVYGFHCDEGVYFGAKSPDGKRFEPSHRLAMCLKADEVKRIEVDEATALKYLKGLTFDCAESEKGWRVVTYMGYPLGWCKAVAGVAKNHLPKGLRI
ncbi:MAG: RsmB/NOP family class I SAM-dependent RNA methyltransferase [Clostridia bacterium]|nr:RsmB/NOP family class I SAM-dependent RNA methyltransferase [Clostridia bacterium]